MNQDTCMKVAVYAVIAIVVILVVRYYLNQEHFANEHHEHKHHEHKHHEHKHHEHKALPETHPEAVPAPFPCDFNLGQKCGRGNVGAGRALVNDLNSTLVVNYAKDFTGGVRVDSDLMLNNNKLFFDTPNNNNSDPYYMQKIIAGGDQSSLRLTLNDNADESFQIWGNSCGEAGGCGGDGALKHKFTTNGNAEHTGDLIVHGDILIRRKDGNDIAIQQDGNVCLRNSSNGNNIKCWNSTVSGGVVLAPYDLPYPRVS